MNWTDRQRTLLTGTAIVALAISIGLGIVGTGLGRADSTPITSLPQGPIMSTTTKPGLLVAVALPHARASSGLVWRIARPYNPQVVRHVSEADIGHNVVLVFKVTGRGDTSLVFGLTRGDTSPTAVNSTTYRIHSS